MIWHFWHSCKTYLIQKLKQIWVDKIYISDVWFRRQTRTFSHDCGSLGQHSTHVIVFGQPSPKQSPPAPATHPPTYPQTHTQTHTLVTINSFDEKIWAKTLTSPSSLLARSPSRTLRRGHQGSQWRRCSISSWRGKLRPPSSLPPSRTLEKRKRVKCCSGSGGREDTSEEGGSEGSWRESSRQPVGHSCWDREDSCNDVI